MNRPSSHALLVTVALALAFLSAFAGARLAQGDQAAARARLTPITIDAPPRISATGPHSGPLPGLRHEPRPPRSHQPEPHRPPPPVTIDPTPSSPSGPPPSPGPQPHPHPKPPPLIVQ
jgi:hypothetical protein